MDIDLAVTLMSWYLILRWNLFDRLSNVPCFRHEVAHLDTGDITLMVIVVNEYLKNEPSVVIFIRAAPLSVIAVCEPAQVKMTSEGSIFRCVKLSGFLPNKYRSILLQIVTRSISKNLHFAIVQFVRESGS